MWEFKKDIYRQQQEYTPIVSNGVVLDYDYYSNPVLMPSSVYRINLLTNVDEFEYSINSWRTLESSAYNIEIKDFHIPYAVPSYYKMSLCFISDGILLDRIQVRRLEPNGMNRDVYINSDKLVQVKLQGSNDNGNTWTTIPIRDVDYRYKIKITKINN